MKVGVTRFERATSWSQTKRSSQAELHPGKPIEWRVNERHYILAIRRRIGNLGRGKDTAATTHVLVKSAPVA